VRRLKAATLYITPVYYIYLDRFERWMRSHKRHKVDSFDDLQSGDLVSSDAHD
jgi:hypothetical protein